MSMHIATFGLDGQIEREVPLPVDPHWELQVVSARRCFKLIPRMEDYYAETEYAVEELPQLLAELDAIASDLGPDTAEVAAPLRELIVYAIANGKLLVVLSD